MAGDHLASWARCDARSLVETLLLGTSIECGQNVVESVTPEHSLPGTALTVLHLNLHLTLSDLTLQLPQSWLWWPWHLGPCPYLCLCPWLAAP